jgi:hypothetical protein
MNQSPLLDYLRKLPGRTVTVYEILDAGYGSAPGNEPEVVRKLRTTPGPHRFSIRRSGYGHAAWISDTRPPPFPSYTQTPAVPLVLLPQIV